MSREVELGNEGRNPNGQTKLAYWNYSYSESFRRIIH